MTEKAYIHPFGQSTMLSPWQATANGFGVNDNAEEQIEARAPRRTRKAT